MTTETAVVAAPASLPALDIANPTPAQMLAMAVQRGDGLDKLEKLMDLQDRWERKTAKAAYVAAMAQFKAHPPTILKDKKVGYENRDGTFTGYTHATLAEVASKIAAGLGAVGISHAWDVQHQGGLIVVSCTLTHEGGHSETVTMPPVAPDDSGKKNRIQQVASAITYQQRYSLLAITGLAARDQDDDARATGSGEDTPAHLTAEQVAELEALIKARNVNRANFLKYARVRQLSEIHPGNFELVKAEIEARKGPQRKSTQADAAAALGGKVTAEQVAELETMADAAGVSERALLARYEVDILAALTIEKFEKAVEWLRSLHS